MWEWANYPQYYIPLADVSPGLLVPEGHSQRSRRGEAELHGLRVSQTYRPRAARVLRDSPVDGLSGTVRFEWAAMDAWLEEDERVFVHPRNPYVRVDALRSTRTVRVELGGAVLAESSSPVMVFETGLPTRYYLNRTEINFGHLIPTGTVTECPYKGTTSGYWSVQADGSVHPDLAWSSTFPPASCCPSPASSRSTTSKSTSSSTGSSWNVRRPISSRPPTDRIPPGQSTCGRPKPS